MIIYKVTPKKKGGAVCTPMYFDDELVAQQYKKQVDGKREDIEVLSRGKSWRMKYQELYSYIAGFVAIINKFQDIVQPSGVRVEYDDESKNKNTGKREENSPINK